MFGMADTLLGTILDGRYRLVDVLSDASPRFVVYRAEHLRLERAFSVKVFRERDEDGAFEAAARKLSCVRHPNIEPIHDYGRLASGHPYLVTELIDGESLAERMERPIHQLDLLQILQDAGAGLAEAHAADLIHGALTPESLIFESHQRGETLKIVDFDPTQDDGAPSFRDATVVANAHWVSPEQAKGLSAEPASDLYALGAIAYACLAGAPPHEGEPHVVLSKKIDSDPTLLRSLPFPVDADAGVDALICAMLEREPFRRPTGAREVAEHAEALHTELTMPPLPRPIRSRVPWLGIAATLMGAAALFVAELRAPDAPRPVVLPTTGSITLESVPSGAKIYVDGEPLLTIDGAPAVTPADVQSLLYGKRYRVQLRQSGYVTWETELTMNAAADGRAFTPSLAPMPARISIQAAPGALIFVDELAVGRGRWVEEMVQPLRPHLIRATSADYDCGERVVRPEPGSMTNVKLACIPSRPSTGLGGHPARLTVTGDPTADVYLDHKRIGSPPIVEMALQNGDHELKILRPRESRTLVVDAEPGNTIRYHVP